MKQRNRSWSRHARHATAFAVALPALLACSAESTGNLGAGEAPLFVTQTAAQTASMQALFEGRVVLDDQGCIRLESPERPMVVWPFGFSIVQAGGEHTVLDSDQQAIGTIGEAGSFRLSGGEVPTLHQQIPVSAIDRERALANCPGIYWIVGE